MPVQEPKVRNHNFDEVALGYTEEQAVDGGAALPELQATSPAWAAVRSVSTFPPLSHKVAERNFEGAYQIYPAVHVSARGLRPGLPAGNPVRKQAACCGIKGEPVGIGRLERFVADWHNDQRHGKARHVPRPTATRWR